MDNPHIKLASADYDESFRRRVIASIGFWLGIIVLVAMWPRYLIAHMPPDRMVIFSVFAIVMLLLPILNRRNVSTGICGSLLLVCLTGIGVIAGLTSGGMRAPATGLFVITPIIGFFCNGKFGARIALGLSISSTFFLLWAEDHSLTQPLIQPEKYAQYKSVIIVFTSVAAYAIGAAYERSRRLWEKALTELSIRAAHSAKMSSLGEMAAGIAHEINNPLAIICGRVTLLKQNIEEGKDLDKEKALQDLQKVEDTVERAAKIIRGLKAFSRNSEKDEMVATKLLGLIEDTVELCNERFRNQKIQLEVNCPGNLELECRSSQVSQIFMNLLSNSIDAVEMLPEKWVEISASARGSVITITVTDSGPGISPDVAKKMVQPFFTTKTVGKGTGLGLSISSGICLEHHGELKYDSQHPNTRFIVQLPIKQPTKIEKAA